MTEVKRKLEFGIQQIIFKVRFKNKNFYCRDSNVTPICDILALRLMDMGYDFNPKILVTVTCDSDLPLPL